MKSDTLLDYAEFQLSPRQTRCELLLSGGGETETLDPVLLEPLIAHLPAAKELANEARHVFKIELHEDENGAPLFTKNTMERFIRFVNTPDVLERPHAIQAEISQLETARKFNLALYSQVNGDRLSSAGLATEWSTSGGPIQSRTATVIEDSSRSELLRALDVRLMTLHQELDRAVAHATAAEFLVENMADLLAFSEHFQASRLRDACIKFQVLCQQRQQHDSLLIKKASACLSGSGMSLGNKTSGETLSEPSRKHDDEPDENTSKEKPLSKSYTDPQYKQESFCFSSLSDNSISKPPAFSMVETEGKLLSPESDNMASSGFEPPPLDKDKQSPEPTRRPLVRSASPMRRVQIGRCGSRRSNASMVRSINYFPHWSNRERDSNRESESTDTDNESGGDHEESESLPKVESARTLSVQDAINLFERKQREQRHSTEGLKKIIQVESRRLSTETENPSTYEKAVLRRWSGASLVGKLDVPNSTMQSLATGKDMCQIEETHSGLKPMDERKDVASIFSSPPKIMELQKMEAEQVKRTDSQHSETSRYPEKYRGSNFSATDGIQRQGPGTSQSSFDSMRGHETTTKQTRSTHELNQLLQEKANRLEAFFAAHKVRSQASEAGSTVPPPVKIPVKDKACMELKSSGVNSEGQSIQGKVDAGNPEEVSHRTDLFTEGEPELEHLLRTMQSLGRDSLSNSSTDRADFDMQTLMNMVDDNYSTYKEQLGALENNKVSDELRGKFYDQYREKREAKLREEHAAKREEKEAKLKAMQEVLERRKAEMAGQGAKLSEKQDPLGQSQARARKLQSSRTRTRLTKNKKELHKPDEDNGDRTNDLHERSFHQKSTINRGPPGEVPSSTSTPRVATDLSKSNGARKISSKSMPPAIPRSYVPLTSSSPRSVIPKVSSASNTSTGRRKSQSPVGGNPLARSMPNLSDLKKESTKALSGRPSSNSTLDKGGAISRGQNKNRSRNKIGNEASHLDVKDSRSSSQSSHGKEEKKNHSQPRKGLVSGSELKSFSAINSEESMLTSKPSFYSKVTKKSSVVPLESKPFLRKGNGIGPGIGRGISKTKASSLDDVLKTVEDEVQVDEKNKKETIEESVNLEPSNIIEGAAEENKPNLSANAAVETVDARVDLDTSEQNMQSMPALNKIEDGPDDCVYQNDISDTDRNMSTVSEVSNVSIFPSKLASSSATNREHNEEIASSSEIIVNGEDEKPSLAAALLHEPAPFTAPVRFTPSGLNSVLVNPVSSKSHRPHSLSQMLAADTDEEQTRQKWGSAQKPIGIPQYSQKDAPKGLKRLLKFGRKSRSETVTTDSISASTFSEGDEDTEELKESRRNIRSGKSSSDRSYDFHSANSSVQSIQSAILRDEHLTGATLLKAPRSFFSLSSFRNRGSDSKSR